MLTQDELGNWYDDGTLDWYGTADPASPEPDWSGYGDLQGPELAQLAADMANNSAQSPSGIDKILSQLSGLVKTNGAYDLAKLARKQAVFSRTTTWVFLAGPVGTVAALLVASLLIPLGHTAPLLAFEGDAHVEWFEGNFEAYEEDKRRRLGEEGAKPKRIRYKPITR